MNISKEWLRKHLKADEGHDFTVMPAPSKDIDALEKIVMTGLESLDLDKCSYDDIRRVINEQKKTPR